MTGFPPVSGNTRFKGTGGQLGVLTADEPPGPVLCTDDGIERSAGAGHTELKVSAGRVMARLYGADPGEWGGHVLG